MCEDYRAAASIDLVHDRADRLAGTKLQMPLRVLWGQHGLVNQCFRPLEDWQAVSLAEVSGKAVACGHYIPEEMPDLVIQEAQSFFS
jgi:haloacetate dehalogenase